jgi:hypothetical protein
VSIRTLLRYGVASTLFVWFQSIVGKPVGELALRRHISTVVAVTIGSFVWLALPTVLMYPQVSAIKRLVLNDQQLSADSEVVSRYRRWDCVPPNVDADEIVKLRTVLAYYSGAAPDLKKEQARSSCKSKDFFSLQPSEPFNSTKDAIDTIREARGYDLWGSPYSWAAVSLGLGVLVAIWSYPTYVWRRTFLKR